MSDAALGRQVGRPETGRADMPLRVSGKNIDIGDSLRSKVESRVAGALAKYFDGSYSGHVTVARDGSGYRTDCVLHLTSGITLEASGSAHDAHESFDRTADRIEKRLRRYKQRLKERSAASDGGAAGRPELAYAVLEAPGEDAPADGEYHPAVIAETTKPLNRLSVSDAVLELDMTGAPVLVFLHAGTGRLNVVYRRRDGAIGWIDPPAPQA
jgi:ribosomal subunit interface protein